MVTMKRDFAFLKKHYGNHTRAAEALGISQRRYRHYRNNGDIPKDRQLLISDRVKLLRLTKFKV
jgi:hypothetical protein